MLCLLQSRVRLQHHKVIKCYKYSRVDNLWQEVSYQNDKGNTVQRSSLINVSEVLFHMIYVKVMTSYMSFVL